MSKVHVLTKTGEGFRVVLHTAMPGGNNSVNKSWQDCWVNDGRAVSVLPVGTGPGQILQAELTNVENGTVLEFSTTLLVESGGATAANVTILADAAISEAIDRLQAKYDRYGYTQET